MPDRNCECPERDGKIRHQRAICKDPVVARLNWYADTVEALRRVRTLAETWAAAAGDTLGDEVTSRTGKVLLAALHDDGYPAGAVLGGVKALAGSWMIPGSSFFCPSAGQAVLDAIKGGEAPPDVKAWYDDFTVTGRDDDGYAILYHRPTGALCRIVPVKEGR